MAEYRSMCIPLVCYCTAGHMHVPLVNIRPYLKYQTKHLLSISVTIAVFFIYSIPSELNHVTLDRLESHTPFAIPISKLSKYL